MNNNFQFSFRTKVTVAAATLFLLGAAALAETSTLVTFPISELGNCESKDACRTYCNDLNHHEACLAFAEAKGMMPKEEIAKAKKLLPLLKAGQTPGGCKSKEACIAYCASSEHAQECAEFGKKTKLLNDQEVKLAEKVRTEGGPGGCKGKEECAAFCNKEENQQTCLDFAKKNKVLSPENIKNVEASGRIKTGLESAPPEVRDCLKKQLGSDAQALQQIESGKLLPTSEIGKVVQGCFQKFLPQVITNTQARFADAPAEVQECLKENVDAATIEKMKAGDTTSLAGAEKIKVCFSKSPKMTLPQPANRQLPEAVKQCLRQKLGPDAVGKIESGRPFDNPESVKPAMLACYKLLEQQRQKEQSGAGGGTVPKPLPPTIQPGQTGVPKPPVQLLNRPTLPSFPFQRQEPTNAPSDSLTQ